jgi:hypothetical protein
MYQKQQNNIYLIHELKKNINNSIKLINDYRDTIKVNNRFELLNHLEFVNNILNDMMPQASPFPISNPTEISSGSLNLKKPLSQRNAPQEWEAQFDESLNLNPPCYLLPPQNVMGFNNLKKNNRAL